MTFGSRGSQPGLFTWPRGIAVGPDNSIVVADSSNHRVQVSICYINKTDCLYLPVYLSPPNCVRTFAPTQGRTLTQV